MFVLTSKPGVDILSFQNAQDANAFADRVPRKERCAGPVLASDVSGIVTAVLKLATAPVDVVVWNTPTDPLNVHVAAGVDGDTWRATAIAKTVSVPAAFTEPARLSALVQAAGNVALLRATGVITERDRVAKLAAVEHTGRAVAAAVAKAECSWYLASELEHQQAVDKAVAAERNRIRRLARKAKQK